MDNTPYAVCRLLPKPARLFPLKINSKLPAITNWQNRATDDDDILESWFTGKYAGHNVGVACGHGLMVLDCDCKDGRPGLESLALLDAMGAPRSLRVRTPTGGIHVYLRTDADLKNGVDCVKGFPGIDVRALGGYVVGPGSIIDGKHYELL